MWGDPNTLVAMKAQLQGNRIPNSLLFPPSLPSFTPVRRFPTTADPNDKSFTGQKRQQCANNSVTNKKQQATGKRLSSPDHPAEDRVLVVEVLARLVRDEELRARRIRARIGHAQHPPLVVRHPGLELVLDLAAPVALASPPGTRRVSPLCWRCERGRGGEGVLSCFACLS